MLNNTMITTRKNRISKKRGFTLVEMLVAVFIFSVSLASLMLIVSRGLRAANQAQKQVTAEYLAIEGLESVRSLRDGAFLRSNNSSNWLQPFDDFECLYVSDGGSDGCNVLFSGSAIIMAPCTIDVDCQVYFSADNADYRQFDNTSPGGDYIDTGFQRQIQFYEGDSDDEIIVDSVVSWDQGEVKYSTNLFRWL